MEAPRRQSKIQTSLFGIQLPDIGQIKKKEDEDAAAGSGKHVQKSVERKASSATRDLEEVFDELELEMIQPMKTPTRKQSQSMSKDFQSKPSDLRRLSTIPSLLLGLPVPDGAKPRKIGDKDIFQDFINTSHAKQNLKYPEIADLRAKASDLRRTESVLNPGRFIPMKRPKSIPTTSKFNAVDTASFLIRKLHVGTAELAMNFREEKSMQRIVDTPLRRIAIITHATEIEQAACIYFAQIAYSKFGSLHGFLAALCYSIDSRDAILQSPISLKDFSKFVSTAGMQLEAAEVVYETVRRAIGGEVIYCKDFTCLAKYFEVILLDFHDWAGHMAKPPRVEKKDFIKPDARTFKPVLIWLYQSGVENAEGCAYHVRKRPKSIDDLLLAIQSDVPAVVPFGFKAHRLYDSFSHFQVKDVAQLVHDRKYLVTGAYKPDWVKFDAHV